MDTKTLKQKLMDVSRGINYLKKDKQNTMQGYNYLSEAKIKETIKREFEKQGIIFNYSTNDVSQYEISPTHKGTKQFCVVVKGTYSFIDIDSEDRIDGYWAGSGTDTGDKGLYKAITGGIKYVLNTNFLIPTGDDPENDNGHDTHENKKPQEIKPEAEFNLEAKIGGSGKNADKKWSEVDISYLEKCKDFDKLPVAFRDKCKKAIELRQVIKEPEKVAPQPKKPKQEPTYTITKNAHNPDVYDVIKRNGTETTIYSVNMSDPESLWCSCPARIGICKHISMVRAFINNKDKPLEPPKGKTGIKPPEEPVRGKEQAVRAEDGENEPPSKGKTPPWAKAAEDKPASKGKIEVLHNVMARKVIGMKIDEAKECLPRQLDNKTVSFLLNYLLEKEGEIEPSDFMERVAELYEGVNK